MRLRNDRAINIFNKGTGHYQHHLLIQGGREKVKVGTKQMIAPPTATLKIGQIRIISHIHLLPQQLLKKKNLTQISQATSKCKG